MQYKTNQVISFEEYLFLQNMGLPYTGFVKGMGYTFPNYLPVQMPHIENNRVQWNTWVNYPVRQQVWDTSPQAVFRSMDYSPEDIINQIKKDNGDGTITFQIGMDKITVPSDPSKYKIGVEINKSSDFYSVSIGIYNNENNQSYFKTITYGEEIVDNICGQSRDISDILIEIGNYNTTTGLVAGVIETGLNPVVERIHPFRPIYYSDGPIYKPALPGYNVGRISGEFIEKTAKYLHYFGYTSALFSAYCTILDYNKGNISIEKAIVDEIFNVIGLCLLPGFLISTTYTVVDVYYPNGWGGLFQDVSNNLYKMYMNQVNESGVMMAPWIMGK